MLSIIVSWRDRRELAAALPMLLASARKVNGDVTVVNFDGSSSMLSEQLGVYASEVNIVHVRSQKYFNKSYAQNLGAAHTLYPILFFCDCDIIVDPETVEHLTRQLQTLTSVFGTLEGVRELEVNSRGGKHIVCFGYELHLRTAKGRVLHIVDNEEDAEDGTRQAPGLLFVKRDDFLSINGYNSRLHGWGWEDQDMIARLTLGAGLTRIMHGHAIHISHDDEARVANYPLADRWESRDRMFRQALAFYDRADFQGTYDLDLKKAAATKHAAADFCATM